MQTACSVVGLALSGANAGIVPAVAYVQIVKVPAFAQNAKAMASVTHVMGAVLLEAVHY